MNVQLIIDSLVRQTMVLIAQVATTAGTRAPLAHLANQVFMSLVEELEAQGVGRKVVADMFGLALRSYQQKVQRLRESTTHAGASTWEAVLAHINQKQVVSRAQVLTHFVRDDVAIVKSILKDLIESGLVYQTGRGESAVYRAAPSSAATQAGKLPSSITIKPSLPLSVPNSRTALPKPNLWITWVAAPSPLMCGRAIPHGTGCMGCFRSFGASLSNFGTKSTHITKTTNL
jgi:hypothetical protein